jgi:hypothetical protein
MQLQRKMFQGSVLYSRGGAFAGFGSLSLISLMMRCQSFRGPLFGIDSSSNVSRKIVEKQAKERKESTTKAEPIRLVFCMLCGVAKVLMVRISAPGVVNSKSSSESSSEIENSCTIFKLLYEGQMLVNCNHTGCLSPVRNRLNCLIVMFACELIK